MTEIQPRRALILVDVQPTFCEGGALGVSGGNDVSARIAKFADKRRDRYTLLATTQDWPIDPRTHFSDSPDFIDTWPPHGVAGTEEAELHPALESLDIDVSVKKGQYAAAYSGFEGTAPNGDSLAEILRDAAIEEIDIVGIAESHCVKETALDARKIGVKVRVFSDLTVPVSEDQGVTARKEMADAGVILIDSAIAL